jgi:hypothetical protein
VKWVLVARGAASESPPFGSPETNPLAIPAHLLLVHALHLFPSNTWNSPSWSIRTFVLLSFGERWSMDVVAASAIVIVIAVAYLANRYVEQPATAYFQRWAERFAAAPLRRCPRRPRRATGKCWLRLLRLARRSDRHRRAATGRRKRCVRATSSTLDEQDRHRDPECLQSVGRLLRGQHLHPKCRSAQPMTREKSPRNRPRLAFVLAGSRPSQSDFAGSQSSGS